MKEYNINKNVIDALESIDQINEVKVSPFFKERTLNRLFTKPEIKVSFFDKYFSPQLQLAALVCVVLVNVYAINKISNDSYEAELSNFATNYGLEQSTETSLFNF
jgi:ubiquinone biosynthesis protein Coq4